MNNKEKAALVAEKAHAGHSYDIFPYMYHIKQVVKVAEELGFDEEIVVACYLHDVMEDSNLSYNDIKASFGMGVAEIVFAVTDELGRNRKERKAKTYPKIRANWKAVAVKLCDRIANTEHSKEQGNTVLVEMYRREYPEFSRETWNDHPDLEKAWNRLHGIMLPVESIQATRGTISLPAVSESTQ